MIELTIVNDVENIDLSTSPDVYNCDLEVNNIEVIHLTINENTRW